MKKLCALLFLLCALFGCSQHAKVLTDDGTSVLVTCGPVDWVSCVMKACPDGYVVVDDQGDNGSTSIIKCKPLRHGNEQHHVGAGAD